MNRLLTLAIVVVCSASAYAQPGAGPGSGSGNGPGNVEETKKMCWIEDIYTCAEAYAANQQTLLAEWNNQSGIRETFIELVASCNGMGTCASAFGPVENPENVPEFLNVRCSKSGSELAPLDRTIRHVIARDLISQPYPPGSDPASGRTGYSHADPSSSVHCFDVYYCNSQCRPKQGATQPYALTDYECYRDPNLSPGWLRLPELIASGELCVGDESM